MRIEDGLSGDHSDNNIQNTVEAKRHNSKHKTATRKAGRDCARREDPTMKQYDEQRCDSEESGSEENEH